MFIFFWETLIDAVVVVAAMLPFATVNNIYLINKNSQTAQK